MGRDGRHLLRGDVCSMKVPGAPCQHAIETEALEGGELLALGMENGTDGVGLRTLIDVHEYVRQPYGRREIRRIDGDGVLEVGAGRLEVADHEGILAAHEVLERFK